MKVSTLLIVTDLREAKQFYAGVMGLIPTFESDERLDLDAGGHEIHVFEGEKEAQPYQHSAEASSTLVFYIDDLEEKISELEANGYQFIHRGENSFARYAAFYGPSGIVHEISEMRT